jgi:two-component system sensor histidine kinase AtoS
MQFEYYAPLLDKNDKVVGVAEVYFDLWSMTQNISAATKNVLILSVISFGLFTIVLFVYSLGLFRKMESAREAQIKSERRALELQDMARVGLFISGLAHQLKNPIAILLGLVNALKKRESLPPQREFIQGLDVETERMSSLVDNFLRFARPIDKVAAKVIAMPRDVVEKLLAVLQKEHPAISFMTVFSEMPAVEIDHDLLFEVLDITCRNAVNATEKVVNPRIEVIGRKESNGAVIAISDNGKGLSPELKTNPQIAFQPFFTTRAGGHGLGLALAKRILDEFGGSISIKPGQASGAVVEISLRLAK